MKFRLILHGVEYMKKILLIFATIIMCILLLSGCGCRHQWSEADCASPKTCTLCGESEGEKLAHQWTVATCATPKTCSLCKETQGDALAHRWEDATCLTPETCSECDVSRGEILEHTYSEWSFETDTMSRSCSLCGNIETAAMDYVLYLKTALRGRWDCTLVTINNRLAYNEFGPQVPFLEFAEDGSIRYFNHEEICSASISFISLDEYDGKYYYNFLLSTEAGEEIDFWYVPEDDSLFSFIFEFERVGKEVEEYLDILEGKWVFDSVHIYDESRKGLDRNGYSVEFFEDGTFTALLDVRIDGAWSIFRDDIIVDDKGTSILLFTLYDGDYYNTTVFLGITEEKTELGFTRTLKESAYFIKDISE